MEYMPAFAVKRPVTVEDAVAAVAEAESARYLAGGTDMVVNIRRGIEDPATLVDVTGIEALGAIEESADGLSIGAAVSLHALGNDTRVQRDYPAVAQAARSVAGPTHQRYGTVGGNLCLDTRCLFYNQSEWWRRSNAYCLKHRGDTCHVAPGGKQCFAAFSGDLAPAALVHDAEVTLVSPEGARRILLAELYRNDGLDHLTLKPGELLTTLHLPKATADRASAYEKARVRGSIDFPLAGAAVSLVAKDGALTELSIALTACSPHPYLITGTDKFCGKPLDDALLDTLREEVRKQAKPMRTTTVQPWYRRRVVGAIARRLVQRLAGA